MSAIATSADGNYIYLALEDAGNQVIVRCTRDDLATWAAVYAPGAGTAANVATVPGNPVMMLFYGHFGSGAQVISHVVSTGAETNISPAGLAAKVVNGLAVNPSDAAEIIITVNTDYDLLRTLDGGTTWETLNGVVGFDPTSLAALWQSEAEYHILYLAGQVAGSAALRYSPNTGEQLSDTTGAALAAASQVVGVEACYALAA